MRLTPADARALVAALLDRAPRAVREDREPYGAPLPTGSLSLDLLLGGGYPVGRLAELYGEDGAGRTTLALAAVAACQRAGHACAYVDAERALDPAYTAACGVDVARLPVVLPADAEQALWAVLALIPAARLIVVNSLAALVPAAELAGRLGEDHSPALPRLLGQFTLEAAAVLRTHKTVLLVVNQLRTRPVLYGNPEAVPGGTAVPYAAATRLDVRREPGLDLKEGGRLTGVGALVTVRKHPGALPLDPALVPIRLGHGVDHEREAYLLGRRWGVLARSGPTVSFEGELLGAGQPAVLARLRNDPDLTARLTDAVLEAARGERAPAPCPAEEDTA